MTRHFFFSPFSTYSNLKALNKHFRVGRQEDAHEFLRHLIEALQNTSLKVSFSTLATCVFPEADVEMYTGLPHGRPTK